MKVLLLSFIIFFITFFFFRYVQQKEILPQQKQPVVIRGDVTNLPYIKGESRYVTINDIEVIKSPAYLKLHQVRLRMRIFPELSFGDRVEVTGVLTSYGTMNFPTVKVISFSNSGFVNELMSVRESVEEKIKTVLPQKEAGLLIGILLGSPSAISSSCENLYRNTGLSHVVVASGYNMTVLSDFLLALTGSLGLTFSSFLTVSGLFLYALLLGFDPPVLRSFLMVSFAMVGLLTGKKKNSLRVLFASAIFMLLLNPLLVNSVSFQLSFMATLGLVVLGAPLNSLFVGFLKSMKRKLVADNHFPQRYPRSLKFYTFAIFTYIFDIFQLGGSFSSTLAATLFVFPIMAFHFGRISLVSFASNTFLLWTTPITMFFGVLSVVVLPLSKFLFKLLAWCSWPFLKVFNCGAEIFSRFPLKINAKFTKVTVLFYYLIIFVLCAIFLDFWETKKSGDA